jgi:Gram-negative porin
LKGAEDLGGGLKAVFTLENGVATATGMLGQGGLIFGRKEFVGATSTMWSTLTAGRQYSVSNDFTSQFASGADWAASDLSHGTHAGFVAVRGAEELRSLYKALLMLPGRRIDRRQTDGFREHISSVLWRSCA